MIEKIPPQEGLELRTDISAGRREAKHGNDRVAFPESVTIHLKNI